MIKVTNIKLVNDQKIEEVKCLPINLILGGNNTGKSTLLKDIGSVIREHRIDLQVKWVSELTINIHDPKNHFQSIVGEYDPSSDFQTLHDKFRQQGYHNFFGFNYDSGAHNTFLHNSDLKEVNYIIDDTNTQKHLYNVSHMLSRMSLAEEFCDKRLAGPFMAEIDELDQPLKDVIHYLLLNTKTFKKLADVIYESFNIRLIFDDLQQKNKHIRLAPAKTITQKNKMSMADIMKYWKENSPILNEQGDGLKAFFRIVSSIFNQGKSIILIDEPETFLHQPQRISLGKFIGENVVKDKQLFIATHDSEFLRGLLTSNIDKSLIQIIHLKGGAAPRTYNLLNLNDFKSSTAFSEDILSSFFHSKTVLCEAEDDRMIYQYAARKYFPRESADIQFTAHNGKQEVLKAREMLLNRKINAICILDIDCLYSKEIMSKSIAYTPTERQIVQQCITFLNNKLGQNTANWETNKSDFQRDGIKYFSSGSDRKILRDAIKVLKNHGIVVLSAGTLESLLGINKKIRKQIQEAINKINEKENKKLKRLLKIVVNR